MTEERHTERIIIREVVVPPRRRRGQLLRRLLRGPLLIATLAAAALILSRAYLLFEPSGAHVIEAVVAGKVARFTAVLFAALDFADDQFGQVRSGQRDPEPTRTLLSGLIGGAVIVGLGQLSAVNAVIGLGGAALTFFLLRGQRRPQVRHPLSGLQQED